MKIKNDGIALKDRIGKVPRERIYYCPDCGAVYVGGANCPLCDGRSVAQAAMRKAKGMEAYRPALTRGAGERGELHWSEEIRARILDVFLQYGEQLKQLPYGQKRFTVDLNGLEYVLVFTASHALYKWPIEQL
ncbi:MAG: hypothetical protein ACTTKS_04090 [Bulleidia sp.]